MTTTERGTYHHGDLRAALVTTATQMLESGEPFSMRGVARGAGVSPTAPYRHFADRQALESAVAVEGFIALGDQLAAAGPARTVEDLARLAMVYVEFALDRPAMFKLMFGQECDDSNDARVQASGEMGALLQSLLHGVFPESDPQSLSVAVWALVHGLAFLHLDGKLASEDRGEVADRVLTAVTAILAATPVRA